MGSLKRSIRRSLGRRWRTIPKEAMPKHARQSGCERKGKQADWYVRRRDDGYVSERGNWKEKGEKRGGSETGNEAKGDRMHAVGSTTKLFANQ